MNGLVGFSELLGGSAVTTGRPVGSEPGRGTMKLRMIRLGPLLVGNAIGLWIASLILNDDMRFSGLAFVLAVAIFTSSWRSWSRS